MVVHRIAWRLLLPTSLLAVVALPAAPGCFGQDCVAKDDVVPEGDVVTIVLRNTTGAVLFVDAGEGCSSTPFELTHDGKAAKWNRGVCEFSCEDVIAGDCACAADCAPGSLVRIEPGASHSISWDRSIYAVEDLSLECPAEGCPTQCSRRAVAGDGSYTLTAVAGTACDPDSGTCTCSDGQDACTLPARLDGEPTITTSVTFALPDDAGGSVELALQ
ncbi:MAG: hypothetical protein IPK74_01885 [Deltaproteobacteria bacterium]|nr:hypothetical protein [Deltaproteobacteria bacterium]